MVYLASHQQGQIQLRPLTFNYFFEHKSVTTSKKEELGAQV